MIDLDRPETFEPLDPEGMLGCVEEFGDQCRTAIEIGWNAPLPDRKEFRSIVVVGMGGSAIGGRCCSGADGRTAGNKEHGAGNRGHAAGNRGAPESRRGVVDGRAIR